jgi:uncharacterized protein
MPEYLYPGVYVEEVDTGNKPIEGVSTSTVGFLGIAERGPAKPMLMTSFSDYTQAYGLYVREQDGTDRYLAYAVEGFFQNGGKRCYVQRVFHVDPNTAGNSAAVASAKAGGMVISAVGPGTWGNRVAYQIGPSSLDPTNANLFNLTVMYWAATPPAPLANPTTTEVFQDLSAVPTASNFYETEINDVSNLVTVKQTTNAVPAAGNATLLTQGTDGVPATLSLFDFTGDGADPAKKIGLAALADVDEISILCCPDEFYLQQPTIANQLSALCTNMKDRFAILQAPLAAGLPNANNPPVSESYSAYYYPWLRILNPLTGVPLLVPPGGHVAGVYARSDSNVGVHKDPANEVINGIVELQLQINDGQQSILNPKGVNVLRYFNGAGNLVWGGRTTSRNPDWKYINVRRLFIFVEKSIQRGTQWVVFDINDEPTWAKVRRSISAFLTNLWRDGMLQGSKKEEAFFVKCDRTTMTQADIDNGRLICLIGIAPVKPAEFVIFRIGQWYGGSDVTES